MPIVVKRPPGLRKFVPQPIRYAQRYGKFSLTARDYAILDLVHRYRYLEGRHIRALIDGSDQQITRRLQGLFHNQYLGRYAPRQRMRPDLDTGAPLIAYGLELMGARALETHRAHLDIMTTGEPELVRWKKAYTRRTEWFLEHHLMISNFRCGIELALRSTPSVGLVRWDQGQDTWLKVRIPGERSRIVRVAPDATFSLCQGGEVRHFFLEMDRSTEEHRRLLAKYAAYWAYLQANRPVEAQARRPRVNVLFVTSGEQRMLNMMETLRRMPTPNRAHHAGKALFWFCVEGKYHLTNPTSILGPIWCNTSQVRHALAVQGAEPGQQMVADDFVDGRTRTAASA